MHRKTIILALKNMSKLLVAVRAMPIKELNAYSIFKISAVSYKWIVQSNQTERISSNNTHFVVTYRHVKILCVTILQFYMVFFSRMRIFPCAEFSLEHICREIIYERIFREWIFECEFSCNELETQVLLMQQSVDQCLRFSTCH